MRSYDRTEMEAGLAQGMDVHIGTGIERASLRIDIGFPFVDYKWFSLVFGDANVFLDKVWMNAATLGLFFYGLLSAQFTPINAVECSEPFLRTHHTHPNIISAGSLKVSSRCHPGYPQTCPSTPGDKFRTRSRSLRCSWPV